MENIAKTKIYIKNASNIVLHIYLKMNLSLCIMIDIVGHRAPCRYVDSRQPVRYWAI